MQVSAEESSLREEVVGGDGAFGANRTDFCPPQPAPHTGLCTVFALRQA